MKKIVTTWLCAAFISTFSFAQFEIGTHTSAPNFERVLQGDNLALIYDGFFAFNDTGQIVGSDYFPCQVQGSAIIALDSSTTWVNACVSDIIFTNLAQYDKEMNLNQTVPLYGDIYNPSKGSGLSGNRIVLSEETYLQANNMDGTFIWAVTNSVEITDLHTTHGDTILAVSPGGLTLYSQSGSKLHEFTSYHFTQMELTEDSNWVAIDADSLYLLAPSFEIIKQIKLEETPVIDIETEFGKVVLLTQTKKIYYYDLQLGNPGNFTLSGENLQTFASFELAHDGIIVEGRTQYGLETANFYKKYLWDGTDTYTENNDVGILGVDLGNDTILVLDSINAGWNTTKVYRLDIFNPVFTIKNHGETIVNNILINNYFPIIYLQSFDNHTYYLNGTKRKAVSNLSLAPGETKHITLDKLSYYFKFEPNGENHEHCFWTSLPNGKVDDNPENDRSCISYTVETEEISVINSISLYPNPASHQLFIETGTPLPDGCTWALYDLYGKAAAKAKLAGGISSHTVGLPYLPTGLYAWHLTGADGTVTSGKLVIAQ